MFPPWPRTEGTEQKVSRDALVPGQTSRATQPQPCMSQLCECSPEVIFCLCALSLKIPNPRAPIHSHVSIFVARTVSNLWFTSDCICLTSSSNRRTVLRWGSGFPSGYKPSHYPISFFTCKSSHTGSPTGIFLCKLGISGATIDTS